MTDLAMERIKRLCAFDAMLRPYEAFYIDPDVDEALDELKRGDMRAAERRVMQGRLDTCDSLGESEPSQFLPLPGSLRILTIDGIEIVAFELVGRLEDRLIDGACI